MKKPLLALLLIGVTSVYAQSSKSKSIKIPVPDYATDPLPEGTKTYMARFANTEGSVLPFSEEEFGSTLNFQDIEKHTNDDTAPNLLFALSGIGINDLDLTISRSKANENYSVSVVPSSTAALKMITIVNGVNTHYEEFRVLPRGDVQGAVIPEIIDFSFKEEEKYLVKHGDDQAKGTPYFVQEYLKERLGKNYLSRELAPKIYARYDIRTYVQNEKFYYLKDKKSPELEDETKAQVLSLEEVAASFKTITALRAGKDKLAPFKAYWEAQLGKFDLSAKSDKKLAWGILMNLHNLSIMIEDFEAASKYINQATEMEQKKWITKTAKSTSDKRWARYALNYDKASGERIYGNEYVVDPLLAKHAAKEEVKKSNISYAPGHVIKSDGSKMEGKISMRFSKAESSTSGNIVDISGDNTAKRVSVTYVNEKGKTKNKIFKCKEVAEIVVDGKTFESVNPKKPFLQQEALSMSMLNNTVFMQRIFKSDKISMFKDLTVNDKYYFQIPGVKKAEVASAEFFSACDTLAKKIDNKEFSNTEEDQIKIAKMYAGGCK
jgi:hypothetical protein